MAELDILYGGGETLEGWQMKSAEWMTVTNEWIKNILNGFIILTVINMKTVVLLAEVLY